MTELTETERYEAELIGMAERARQWRAANPKTLVMVQFNFPPQVGVIATLSDALEHHLVTVNEGGCDLLKAIAAGCRHEPSVLMLRAVLEFTSPWGES